MGFGPMPARADASQLSPERFDWFDQRGYFTPAFKAAIHDLVATRQAVEQAKIDERQLTKNLPDLKKQVTEAEAKVADLRVELAKYDQTDESDFTALQNAMKDSKAKPGDQLALAQAYVWGYPTSSHQAEAQQDVQTLQKKIAELLQAAKDDAAAKLAKREDTIKRAQAHQLSLDEWKGFLMDMSQQDVLKYMGHPQSAGADFWVFRGDWTTDPITLQKVGLMVSFNGTRVNVVTEAPPP